MKRNFKPGDRVRLKTGGPVMEVIKYVENKDFLLRRSVSNNRLLCVWFDQKEGRKKGVFHQNSLIKARLPLSMLPIEVSYLRSSGRKV